MRIDIISLFPEMFNALGSGITGRAQKMALLKLVFWNLRDFTQDKHRTVDDRPYGGGPGMLMKFEPLQHAIRAAKAADTTTAKVVYFAPTGDLLKQQQIQAMSQKKRFIFIAGRYEGIDQRLIDKEVDEVWSIGDYVLSGGELAAMVCIDAITRLIPGSLGDESSAQNDSFTNGLLEYPQYTRPEVLDNLAVPEVLLSGNHSEIAKWRLKHSLGLTWRRRPDLLAEKILTETERTLLNEFIEESKAGVNHE
jgi:tRNA (guanine37-N1)-methyltransferase